MREEAHHNLESLAVDLNDKLKQDEFNVLIFLFIYQVIAFKVSQWFHWTVWNLLQRFLTSDEHTALQKEVSQVKAWLEDDVDINTPTAEFVQNKKAIDELLRPVRIRMTEDQVTLQLWKGAFRYHKLIWAFS